MKYGSLIEAMVVVLPLSSCGREVSLQSDRLSLPASCSPYVAEMSINAPIVVAGRVVAVKRSKDRVQADICGKTVELQRLSVRFSVDHVFRGVPCDSAANCVLSVKQHEVSSNIPILCSTLRLEEGIAGVFFLESAGDQYRAAVDGCSSFIPVGTSSEYSRAATDFAEPQSVGRYLLELAISSSDPFPSVRRLIGEAVMILGPMEVFRWLVEAIPSLDMAVGGQVARILAEPPYLYAEPLLDRIALSGADDATMLAVLAHRSAQMRSDALEAASNGMLIDYVSHNLMGKVRDGLDPIEVVAVLALNSDEDLANEACKVLNDQRSALAESVGCDGKTGIKKEGQP